MKNKLRILLAIPTNGSDGRMRLAGMLRFADSRTNWDIRIISSRTAFNDREIDSLLREGVDGCILAAYTPAVEKLLDTGIPCVLALENLHSCCGSRGNCRSVLMDNTEIGRLAAEHFKSLGRFASYAFVPAPGHISWSQERKAAFATAADRRADFAEYPEAPSLMINYTSEDDILSVSDGLGDFLLTLPKPAAVFAANDILAVQVARACQDTRLRVPKDVSILGCDNDEILCLSTKPQISSIRPAFEEAGFAATKTLDKMLRGRPPSERVIRIPGALLVPRASTTNLPPAVAVANAAMEYINEHALDGISTVDVVAHLKISRSLLDLRFRQLRNESVMDTIIGIRLAAVKHRLETTNRKLIQIGAECGFRNEDYLKRLFKKRFGMTMREWREASKR